MLFVCASVAAANSIVLRDGSNVTGTLKSCDEEYCSAGGRRGPIADIARIDLTDAPVIPPNTRVHDPGLLARLGQRGQPARDPAHTAIEPLGQLVEFHQLDRRLAHPRVRSPQRQMVGRVRSGLSRGRRPGQASLQHARGRACRGRKSPDL